MTEPKIFPSTDAEWRAYYEQKCRKLQAENLEWLRAYRMWCNSTTDEEESYAESLLDALRIGNISAETPTPIVERLINENMALRDKLGESGGKPATAIGIHELLMQDIRDAQAKHSDALRELRGKCIHSEISRWENAIAYDVKRCKICNMVLQSRVNVEYSKTGMVTKLDLGEM